MLKHKEATLKKMSLLDLISLYGYERERLGVMMHEQPIIVQLKYCDLIRDIIRDKIQEIEQC